MGVWRICWRDWLWEDASLEDQESVLAKAESDWKKCCYSLPVCLPTGESFNSMVATAATMLFWCQKPEISSFLHGLKACSSPCILQIFTARRRLPRHSVKWTEQPLDSPLLHPTDTHCGLFSSCSANQANTSYLNTSIDIYFIGLLS